MRVSFIPTGPIHYGSSRIRAYWVAEEMEDAYVVAPQRVSDDTSEALVPDSNAYIWQKVVDEYDGSLAVNVLEKYITWRFAF